MGVGSLSGMTAERGGTHRCGRREPGRLIGAPGPVPLEGVAEWLGGKQGTHQLVAQFDEQPYIEGQTAPRVPKWITPDMYIFLQFDAFRRSTRPKVTYVGVAVNAAMTGWPRPASPLLGQSRAGLSSSGSPTTA